MEVRKPSVPAAAPLTEPREMHQEGCPSPFALKTSPLRLLGQMTTRAGAPNSSALEREVQKQSRYWAEVKVSAGPAPSGSSGGRTLFPAFSSPYRCPRAVAGDRFLHHPNLLLPSFPLTTGPDPLTP